MSVYADEPQRPFVWGARPGAGAILDRGTILPNSPRAAILYRHLLSELKARTALPDKPVETDANVLRSLWFAAAGCPCSVERARAGLLPALEGEAETALRDLVQQHVQGTPVSYLTNRAQFMGIELLSAAGALIPRVETEILGHAALSRVRDAVHAHGHAVVIDVCTGSGNIAIALAAHETRALVAAADLSTEAVNLARANARFAGLDDRVSVREGDLLAPFGDDFDHAVDVLTCNPPYISTARLEKMPGEIIDHEPALAFDGGPFGVRILTRAIQDARRLLKPGGWLCLEVGLGQGTSVLRLIERTGGYGQVETFADAAGQVRAIAARWSA
jgi:release factor glutamine methyltransferase